MSEPTPVPCEHCGGGGEWGKETHAPTCQVGGNK